MPRVPVPCLCLVTDRRRCGDRPLEDVVARAVDGGVDLVQLREKDLPAERLFRLAEKLRELIAGRALLFVNDRVDVALACGADGVQLGEEGLPLPAAREAAGDRLLLGRSVHSVEGAVEAESAGAHLLVVGTIFPTSSHPGAEAAGTGVLRRLSGLITIPFVAIGGVDWHNIESVIDSGASGAAVIAAICASDDPERSSRTLRTKMADAWAFRMARRRTESA